MIGVGVTDGTVIDFILIFTFTYLFFCRRQKELEAKLVEEETAKRIEELVAKRVAEELERRKDEIEAEVMRRVQEAKEKMEKEMMEELQRQKMAQLEEERKREVAITSSKPLSILLDDDDVKLFYNHANHEFDITTEDGHLSLLQCEEDETFDFEKNYCSSSFTFPIQNDLEHNALLHDSLTSTYQTLYQLLLEYLKLFGR